MTALSTRVELAAAYSAAGESWRAGPSRIYDELAREQLAAADISFAGIMALDLGAGTGAGTRALLDAGAGAVVAVDLAIGMLQVDRQRRPPAAVADVLGLPFADESFDVVVAAFSLNHVDDPAAALREASRVTAAGGWVLASSYSADDDHPVKGVVESVLRRHGWQPAPWHDWMRAEAVVRLATPEQARRAALEAGLADIDVVERHVPFPALGADELVEWRVGMAQYAPFLAELDSADRLEIGREAVDALADSTAPLVRSVLFLTSRAVTRAAAPPRR